MAKVFHKKYWIKFSTILYYQTNRTRNRIGFILSYDIVKAHGGELKVETKEGEGT